MDEGLDEVLPLLFLSDPLRVRLGRLLSLVWSGPQRRAGRPFFLVLEEGEGASETGVRGAVLFFLFGRLCRIAFWISGASGESFEDTPWLASWGFNARRIVFALSIPGWVGDALHEKEDLFDFSLGFQFPVSHRRIFPQWTMSNSDWNPRRPTDI